MRRLTVILSDLYLAAESVGGGIPPTHELPSLDWLLRFARAGHIGDWRRWLLQESGGASSGAARAAAATWIATPVHLEARLDHVRLVDRGLLRVDAAESEAWCTEFARVFGPQHTLRPGGERAFHLSRLEKSAAPPVDPARLLGGDVGPALPGPGAAEIRRLWTEIEMWLHAAATNTVRERAGRRRLSALWLWGPDLEIGTVSRASRDDTRFDGADPLIRQLAPGAGSVTPATFAGIASGPAHAVVERAPLTGGDGESMAALERDWFAPAKAALARGELAEFALIANDKRFVTRRGDGWQRWRRRRTWLESLA